MYPGDYDDEGGAQICDLGSHFCAPGSSFCAPPGGSGTILSVRLTMDSGLIYAD